MTQEEVLKNMSPMPWDVIRYNSRHTLGIQSGDKMVLWPAEAMDCPKEGMQNPVDTEATSMAVSATFGSGILPEEVKEMVALMESMTDGIRASDIEQMNDLLTRINERKK